MNKTILFLAVMMIAAGVHAQSQRKSSYSKFKRAPSSRSQLDDASKLADKDPGSALELVKDALGVSTAQGDLYSQGRAYVLLGRINENIQEWQLGADNYAQAYEKLKTEFGKTDDFRLSLSGLGRCNLRLGNFSAALQNFQEALPVAKNAAEADEIRLHLSEAHYGLGQYDAALKDLDRFPQEQQKAVPGSSFLDKSADNQRARILTQANRLADSKQLFSNTLSSARFDTLGAEEKTSFITTKDELANAYRAQKQTEDEIDVRNKSIEFNKAQNNLNEVAKDQVEIARTLDASGNTPAAIQKNEEAVRTAMSIDDPAEQANAFLNLASLYERIRQKDKAIHAWHQYAKAVAKKDSASRKELLRKSDLIVKQRKIEEVTKQVELGKTDVTIEHAAYVRQQLIIYGLLALLFVIALTSWFIFRSAQASKRANQLLALKSLRGQMNPHFIFNALNSVNHFIAEQDERAANRFLSEFSQLMRLVLENSQLDFIPLNKEQEILTLYLKLEHYRFRDKFEYRIETDGDIPAELIAVPPMLIQPYIENAVWHGLRYKSGPGELQLRFRKEAEFVVAEITDDGIGRKRSQELKTENQKMHTSTGLRNIEERIGIINRLYHTSYRVRIEDKPGGGTCVTIHMPLVHTIKEAV